jgi:1-acyl-sn-glycerol-3-phosphate acyltransferase
MTILRALAFNAYFFGVTTIFSVGGVLFRVVAPSRILAHAQRWTRTVIWGARMICGIRVVITGRENLPHGGPALLASQHQSAFDTLVWLSLLPAPTYVVKQELTRIPFFGPLLVPAGMIPVNRRGGATALRGLLQATRKARQAGRQIIIFPEGTRVAPGTRVKLQPGIAAIASHLDLPVTPVATDSGLRWGRRAFFKYPGDIHIAIGPAIPAGTARIDMLAAIERFWREAEARQFRPVDKSVGNLHSDLPPQINSAL